MSDSKGGEAGIRRRTYDTKSLAIVCVSFGLFLLLLESGGLVSWASRMSVGPAQTGWLAVLEPFEAGLGRVGLTAPRRLLIDLAEWTGSSMHFFNNGGTGESGDLIDMESIARQKPAPEDEEAACPGDGTSTVDDFDFADMLVESDEATTVSGGGAGQRMVVLVGDSMMAVGLAPSLVRMLDKDVRFKVIRAHKSATGLSRPEIYNWPDAYRAVQGKYRPDFVMCAMGGNDAQNVRHEGKVLKFGTVEWDNLYRERVREMARLFSTGNTRTLWIGLPVMRAADFRKKIEHVNALVRDTLKEFPTVEFMESSPAVCGKDGSFVSQVQDAKGKMIKIRAEDGIHLSDAGGRAIAELAVKWLRARADQ